MLPFARCGVVQIIPGLHDIGLVIGGVVSSRLALAIAKIIHWRTCLYAFEEDERCVPLLKRTCYQGLNLMLVSWSKTPGADANVTKTSEKRDLGC